jgi:hypothetical protein
VWSRADPHPGKVEFLPISKIYLNGPKLEIFGSRVFPQIRPVWVGDLGFSLLGKILMV